MSFNNAPEEGVPATLPASLFSDDEFAAWNSAGDDFTLFHLVEQEMRSRPAGPDLGDEVNILFPNQPDSGDQSIPSPPKAQQAGGGTLAHDSESGDMLFVDGADDADEDDEESPEDFSESESEDYEDYSHVISDVPLFGIGKPLVNIDVTDAEEEYVRRALTTHDLVVPNHSPRGMDLLVDDASTYLQRQGLYPTKQEVQNCHLQHDMEELLERYEDDPMEYDAQPSFKRNVSYHLAERTLTAALVGHPGLCFDACVITSPMAPGENYTVTICHANPGEYLQGTLFFYREPYLEQGLDKYIWREKWHALVPRDIQQSLPAPHADERVVHHNHSHVALDLSAPPALTVPPTLPAPAVFAQAAAPRRKPRGTKGPRVSHDARHSASGRPFVQYTDHEILNGAVNTDLIYGELAIRIGINHEYNSVEDAIKAQKPGEYGDGTKMFTKRVTGALALKAKQLGIPMGTMRMQYRAAKKAAAQAAKNHLPLPALPGWVIS